MALQRETLPPGCRVVVDSMVFLNFSYLRRLDDFFMWMRNTLAVTPVVVQEVVKVCQRKYRFGNVDLDGYIARQLLYLERMDSQEETRLYHGYFNQIFGKKIFGPGEASCLAVALHHHYGFICDEKEVRDEYELERKRRSFAAPAWSTGEIIRLAAAQRLISEREKNEMVQGLGCQ